MPTGIYIRTEEHNKKNGEARKGKKLSSETRRKISEARKGRKHREETKMKIKELRIGKKHTEESKRKMSKARKGIKLSENHKEKISKSAKKFGIGKWMKGKKALVETIKKRSLSLPRGKKNHFWKGGVSSVNTKIRSSLKYKLWRKSVFERDNYQCIWGGKKHGSKLNADHIKSFAYYPELRFDIDNGRTLCVDCHKKTDTYLKKLK